MTQAWDKEKSESPTGIKPMTSRTPGGYSITDLRELMESKVILTEFILFLNILIIILIINVYNFDEALICYSPGKWFISSDGNRKCSLANWSDNGGNSCSNRKREDLCTERCSYPFCHCPDIYNVTLKTGIHWWLKKEHVFLESKSSRIHRPLQKHERTGKEYGCFLFVWKTKMFKWKIN